ncbi:hypothetical protein [Peribacillus simplex]|uniref:Uncharacterized protein n=1 Tax=Peribacillus simplex TaxID=1478 RepID=A0AAW7IFQ4_9BACI|nr:hypothetical protein [Peribacillus simplex]MDM5452319.1 hypothetical protein [Peribacillus simplex]
MWVSYQTLLIWAAWLQVPDIDEQAHSLGRHIVQELDKEGDSDYILNDGALHDYTEFDLVWIASLVPNNEEILECIFQTNPDATVVIRSMEAFINYYMSPLIPTKFSKVACEEVRRTIADTFTIIQTCITHLNSDIIGTSCFLQFVFFIREKKFQ